MARIEFFRHHKLERLSLHDPVEASLYSYEIDDRRLLQINTIGRSTRRMKGKVSQSIQLEESSARQLFDEIGKHFGFK